MVKTVVELETMLNNQRDQALTLARQRETKQQELDDIDRQLADLLGPGGKLPNGRRRKRRPQNTQSLRAVVLDILKKHKAGYTLADIAQKVLDTGYKSSSHNFRNVLYQCLYNTKQIQHNSDTGCYALQR